MNNRINKLRKLSVEAEPTLSIERALIETEFYKENYGKYPIPVLRALNFMEICKRKTIYIGEDELIVGERGPKPKAVPTFPELTCHSAEDLNVLNTRELQRYTICREDIETYEKEVIPYWEGKTQRERIFGHVPDEWRAAYEAGLFTEFMEQRAPGHTALDGKIYKMGMLDFKKQIAAELRKLDFLNDPEATDKQEQLRAMDISCDAVILFAERHAQLAEKMADDMEAQMESEWKEKSPAGHWMNSNSESHSKNCECKKHTTEDCCENINEDDHQKIAPSLKTRAAELRKIAEVCRRVPAFAPHTFWEAIQMYWFVHLGTITELNGWDAMNPGHLDQHLAPFYEKEIAAGSLTREEAKELIACFWIKVNNHPAPPKVGITAKESGTYNDFTNINIGGVKADGSDGVSEVSYIILEVLEELHILQPGASIHISSRTPERFLKAGCNVIRKGYGYPSVFNADAYIQELTRQGKSLTDAREGGCSGCIEVGAFGKEAYLLTGYLNVPKILEITLNNGTDPVSGKVVGIKTGDPLGFKNFEELYDAFIKQLNYITDLKVRVSNYIDRMFAKYAPATFLSVVIEDCIRKGKDYYNGGPRYNTNYIQCTGLGTVTDSLSAIKWHVFENGTFSMEKLLNAVARNFEGEEILRQTIINKTPFFGNNDNYADSIAVRVYNDLFNAIEGKPNTKGECFHLNMLSTTCHVYFGKVMGATPNGRPAGRAISDGTSPSQGSDTHGPTSVIQSLGRLDQIKSGGTLLNLRFLPNLVKTEQDVAKLASLIRTYFSLSGHHIQFNIVDTVTLRDAQQKPEEYRDLLVRMAGYSDYFNDMNTDLQEEIISRTENDSF
ncbi:MAG TPA: glycyl radical protein [Bacteroidales bacterium]|nr:glycyl radical protein [Bacteroidales bacterium]